MGGDVCAGPLIWYEAPAARPDDPPAAILECASCPYIVITGALHDARHAMTPLLREGLRM